ncbi:hypothetical protein BDV98DRAFT_607239 [Pterulicium gracile]|uniref:Uncharacterized protein n=1 Tax=Pterulicium gracile TaxID=1884261 RepID=A0A5C3QC22_9AGAR|nr:hypothetical protein BDV98DRAFT_607239 [Pterula gracilis]
MTSPTPGPSSPTNTRWHSIRPWTPRLYLVLREITSVSVTFILASSSSSTSSSSRIDEEMAMDLGSWGTLEGGEEGDEQEDDLKGKQRLTSSSTSTQPASTSPATVKRRPIVGEALKTKGLAVTVNGVPTQRVLIRIDDKTDEGVIIIFGLMPGREYDVELGLVDAGAGANGNPDGEVRVRREIVTAQEDHQPTGSSTPSPPASPISSTPASSSPTTSPTSSPQPPLPPLPSASTPHSSTSASLTSPQNHSNNRTTPTPSIDDHLTHLHHTLSLLTSERDILTASLKSTRRSSQRADATLRTELDVLAKSSAKNATAEHRARQKVLALMESVKQARSAAEEVNGEAGEVEGSVPGFVEIRKGKQVEWERTKGEEKVWRKEWAQEKEEMDKRVEGIRSEVGAVGKVLERLGAKRERLEGRWEGKEGEEGKEGGKESLGVIGELEREIGEVEREVERVLEEEALIHAQNQPAPLWSPSRSSQAALHAQSHHTPHTPSKNSPAHSLHQASSHSLHQPSSHPHGTPTHAPSSSTSTLASTSTAFSPPLSSPGLAGPSLGSPASLFSRAAAFEPRIGAPGVIPTEGLGPIGMGPHYSQGSGNAHVGAVGSPSVSVGAVGSPSVGVGAVGSSSGAVGSSPGVVGSSRPRRTRSRGGSGTGER